MAGFVKSCRWLNSLRPLHSVSLSNPESFFLSSPSGIRISHKEAQNSQKSLCILCLFVANQFCNGIDHPVRNISRTELASQFFVISSDPRLNPDIIHQS